MVNDQLTVGFGPKTYVSVPVLVPHINTKGNLVLSQVHQNFDFSFGFTSSLVFTNESQNGNQNGEELLTHQTGYLPDISLDHCEDHYWAGH
jgi:hypothetical protein